MGALDAGAQSMLRTIRGGRRRSPAEKSFRIETDGGTMPLGFRNNDRERRGWSGQGWSGQRWLTGTLRYCARRDARCGPWLRGGPECDPIQGLRPERASAQRERNRNGCPAGSMENAKTSDARRSRSEGREPGGSGGAPCQRNPLGVDAKRRTGAAGQAGKCRRRAGWAEADAHRSQGGEARCGQSALTVPVRAARERQVPEGGTQGAGCRRGGRPCKSRRPEVRRRRARAASAPSSERERSSAISCFT